MTLDEAIKHAEEVAEEHTKYNRYGGFESCDECAEEHRQLALWLKELKECKEQEPCTDAVSRGVFEQVMYERDIAIEQLHELGYEWGQKIEPCDDAISRQAVLDGIAEWIVDGYADSEADCSHISSLVTHLPSVKPQKSGKWIAIENEEMETIGYYCSKCDLPMETEEQTDYCPNCGARMERSE